MFKKYIEPITWALKTFGLSGFRDERHIVDFVLEQLAMNIQEDQPINPNGEPVSAADQIATQGEVEDISTVLTVLEAEADQQSQMLRDITNHIIQALNKTRVLKSFSGQADLPQGFSDELWRESVCAGDTRVRIRRALWQVLSGSLTLFVYQIVSREGGVAHVKFGIWRALRMWR
jgi:hypothetical protein